MYHRLTMLIPPPTFSQCAKGQEMEFTEELV
jgi:hypothetical protein